MLLIALYCSYLLLSNNMEMAAIMKIFKVSKIACLVVFAPYFYTICETFSFLTRFVVELLSFPAFSRNFGWHFPYFHNFKVKYFDNKKIFLDSVKRVWFVVPNTFKKLRVFINYLWLPMIYFYLSLNLRQKFWLKFSMFSQFQS